jgi:hypothetical protein
MKKNKTLIPASIGWTSPRDVQVVPGAQPTRCSRKREKGLNARVSTFTLSRLRERAG